MSIDVYTVLRNEEAMLPYFLLHYGQFARRIHLCDDGSTDRTKKIAAACPLVEWSEFPGDPDHLEQEKLTNWKNTAWKGSDADWVIVCDIDEFLFFRPSMADELEALKQQGITLPLVRGYEMVSGDGLPPFAGKQLTKIITHGCDSVDYSKSVVFNPAQVDIQYFVGAHACDPQGNVVRGGLLYLYHYNWLGKEYILERWRRSKARVFIGDAERNWKVYEWDKYEEMLYQEMLTVSKNVVGMVY